MAKAKTKIHVNTHVVRRNHKTGERNPAITVRRGGSVRRAHEVVVLGPSRLVYSPDHPLPCGARLWLETDGEVVLLGAADAGSGCPV